MARPPKIIPSQRITLWLPEDLYTRIQLQLFSEAERCIPRGAIQQFFVERLQDYYAGRLARSGAPQTITDIYLGLETIFATASKRGADPETALKAIAKWSRIYADKLLEEPK